MSEIVQRLRGNRRPSAEPFDIDIRRQWAEEALVRAGEAAKASCPNSEVPPDLIRPDGWRWRVLADMTQLTMAINRAYEDARRRQDRQAWQNRIGGPVTTGAGSAIGAVVAAIGAGQLKADAPLGWLVIALGVIGAIVGSIFSASNYVQNRNKVRRFLRLLHDIWDFNYMVLPDISAADAFRQLDTFRQMWETAGS